MRRTGTACGMLRAVKALLSLRMLPVLAWCRMIFGLSAQDAGHSAGLSLELSLWLVGHAGWLFPAVPEDELVEIIHPLVRKAAHSFEYFVLAVLVAWWFRPAVAGASRLSAAVMSFCVAAAAADEFHQLFVPGRAGSVCDVFIDSLGAACGIALILLMMRQAGHWQSSRRRTGKV